MRNTVSSKTKRVMSPKSVDLDFHLEQLAIWLLFLSLNTVEDNYYNRTSSSFKRLNVAVLNGCLFFDYLFPNAK